MADQGLVNYIKRSLSAGVQRQEITAILLQAGWQQSLIDEGFAEVQGIPVPPPVTQGTESAVIGSSSVFEKMRTWLLILIGARLVLIPVQYFFLSLTFSSRAYGYLPSLLGQAGLMGVLLSLLWLLPFFGIRRREKGSYVISIFFAIVLIYLNLYGFSVFQGSSPLYLFSFVYLITGVAIIILAISSLKYFPKQSEQPNLGVSIDESKTSMAKMLAALLFGITVVVPGFLGLGLAGSIGDRLSRPSYGGDFFGGGGDVISSVVAAFLLGALLGWFIESGLIDRVRRGTSWYGLGAMAGFLGGAIAQLPLYGFSGIQIIAMPVGAVIGVLLGVVGIGVLGSITAKAIKI